MPAASTKPDKASPEAGEPIKQVLQVIEKKVRNLEKRKTKLDTYKEKANEGQTLEKDQQIAVDRYDEVIQNLEFAKDLQKCFQTINTDAEKMAKKQAKREKMERQSMISKKVQELLLLQNLLDSLGADRVREDFQSGKHGAVVLTEDNLNQLDTLYKLISPSREGEESFNVVVTQATEHIMALLDAKEKEVAGTTYKDLKELVDLINNCGYFENAPQESAEEVKSGDQEFVVVDSGEVPHAESDEVQASLPPQIHPEPSMVQETSQDPQQQEYRTAANADSFFSKAGQPEATMPPAQNQVPHSKPVEQKMEYKQSFQEIVSSVQGFNFIQESTIELESGPHIDPAVVAAMPSTQHSRVPDSSNLSSQTYSNQGYDLQQQTMDAPHTSEASSLHPQQQSVSNMPSGPQDFTSQNAYGQSLQNDNLFQSSVVEDSAQISQLGQPSGEPNMTQFDMPPPALPMPPGHDPNSQKSPGSQKKEFQMNPNAQMFQSQYYNQQQQQQEGDFSQQSQNQDFNRSNYQGNNYQSGGYRGGGKRGGGGFRGKDNRGAVSNGYGNRGGSAGRGGFGHSGGRGGSYGNQGFQQRNDYRQDNYQSFNGNFNGNNNGFQKRGGFSRGGNRGGGGMRGGSAPPRGGPRGASRGGSGGGFGRPSNMATPQQTA